MLTLPGNTNKESVKVNEQQYQQVVLKICDIKICFHYLTFYIYGLFSFHKDDCVRCFSCDLDVHVFSMKTSPKSDNNSVLNYYNKYVFFVLMWNNFVHVCSKKYGSWYFLNNVIDELVTCKYLLEKRLVMFISCPYQVS